MPSRIVPCTLCCLAVSLSALPERSNCSRYGNDLPPRFYCYSSKLRIRLLLLCSSSSSLVFHSFALVLVVTFVSLLCLSFRSDSLRWAALLQVARDESEIPDSPGTGSLFAMTNPASVSGLGAITLIFARAPMARIQSRSVSCAWFNLCSCFRLQFLGWRVIG